MASKKSALPKMLIATVLAASIHPYVYASTAVGIDSLDSYDETGSSPVVTTGTVTVTGESGSDGPTVITDDDDSYYPGAEIDTTLEDTESMPVSIEEEASATEEDNTFSESETKQTGIPRLGQYTDVSEEENTRWRIPDDSESSYNRRFEAYISSGTIRLEVFYTAGADSPEIVFTSSGGNHYSMTEGSKNLGRTVFKVKNGYSVKDFPDMKYSIIYISNAEDPGKWDISIRLNNGIKEFAMLTTEIPTGWELLDTDYKTQPKELLLWYLAESGVDITKPSTHSIEDMVQILSKDTEIPSTNDINSTEVKKQTETSNPLSSFFLVLIMAIILGVVSIALILKKIREQSMGLIRNRITFANKAHRRNAKHAEDTIDKIMTEDMSAYFVSAPSSEKAPEEIKPTPVPIVKPIPVMADGPAVYRSVPDYSTNDEDFF